MKEADRFRGTGLLVVCFALLRSVAVLGVPDIVAEQLPSLMQVKAALDPKAEILTNWNVASPACNWKGIACDASGFVTRIHFSSEAFNVPTFGNVPQNLESSSSLAGGTLSAYLGNLTSLEHLIFFGMEIQGAIPSTIGQLTQLKTLILSLAITYEDTGETTGLSVVSAALNGSLPESMGSLSNLVYLDLSRCRFSGTMPSSIGQLSLLQYLDLSENHDLGGDLSLVFGTATLPALTYLDLSINNFTGAVPSSMGSFTKLAYLNLGDNSLEGDVPSSLGNLSSLILLDLSNNFLTSLPASIPQLQLLQTLKLDFNAFSGRLPSGLETMLQLRWLGLGSNAFAGDVPDLSSLISLTWLDLSFNNFSSGPVGGMPAFLVSLSKLTHVFLDFNKWGGAIPGNLSVLTSLQTWSCSWCGLSGSLPTHMGSFSSLRALYLDSNNLGGTIPDSIGGLSELRTLDLSSNQLSGPIPSSISSLTKLNSLVLYNNSLTGPIPSGIGKWTYLVDLLLSQNQFSGPIPDALSALPGLTQLDLSSNSLTGGFPLGLANAHSMACAYGCALQSLSLSNNPLKGNLPVDVGNLVYLTILDVHNCSFNGSIPSELFNLQFLDFLDLSDNSFSGSVDSTLLTDMNLLTSLSMANNQLVGAIPSLVNVTSLALLDLSHNQFSGSLPSYFPNTLVDVDLSDNNLTGEVTNSFDSLTSLETLILSNNQLGGPIPVLSAAPNLTVLSLSNNFFNGTIPQFYLNDSNIEVDLLGNNAVCTPSTSGSLTETLFCASQSPDTTYVAPPVCFNDTCSSTSLPSPFINGRTGLCLCSAPLVVELQLYPALVTTFTKATSRRIQVAFARSLGTARSQIFVSQAVPVTSRGLLVKILFFSRTTAPLPFVNSSRILQFLFANGTYPGLLIPRAGFANLVSYTIDVLQLPSSSSPGSASPAPLPMNAQPGSDDKASGSLAPWALGVIIVGCIAILLAFAAVIFASVYRKKNTGETKDSSWFALRVEKDFVRRFSLAEIYAATNKMSEDELIGVGAYGSVYRGRGPAGEEWAVKRAKSVSQKGVKDFQNEVNVLSRMRHRNIVTLLGFCDERKEQILVYELMPNGSLKDRLQQAKGSGGKNLFPLPQRVDAAIGAAEGLKYLHMFAKPTIIHRDVKPDNILFDSDNEARLADFGLLKDNTEAPIDAEYADEAEEWNYGAGQAPLRTKVTGTPGYIDPDYYTSNQVSTKSDVYSFGVVLFELITGQPPLVAQDESQRTASGNSNSHVPLAQWAKQNMDNLLDFVDPSFHDDFNRHAMGKLAALAFECITRDSSARPDMDSVCRRLGDIRDHLRAGPSSGGNGTQGEEFSSKWESESDTGRELLMSGKQSGQSGESQLLSLGSE
eukprot:TRINITY_DN464_c0_g1_i1.p1 TRINITY_DN464_c0_g1~~TRINITY_DN464_c0_g1_i1.p1  ORF type:complete len:1372 (-),score=265.73 TRINITY_DN464_c0_g1_i1:941-5056(-)